MSQSVLQPVDKSSVSGAAATVADTPASLLDRLSTGAETHEEASSIQSQHPGSKGEENEISKSRTTAVICCVTLITALGTFTVGILTVDIPLIAHELHMDTSLELW